jgi:hypothetical protein
MSCTLCASDNQAEFSAEINVHFAGVRYLARASVFVFPKLCICLDCGFSSFTTPPESLSHLLRKDAA